MIETLKNINCAKTRIKRRRKRKTDKSHIFARQKKYKWKNFTPLGSALLCHVLLLVLTFFLFSTFHLFCFILLLHKARVKLKLKWSLFFFLFSCDWPMTNIIVFGWVRSCSFNVGNGKNKESGSFSLSHVMWRRHFSNIFQKKANTFKNRCFCLLSKTWTKMKNYSHQLVWQKIKINSTQNLHISFFKVVNLECKNYCAKKESFYFHFLPLQNFKHKQE